MSSIFLAYFIPLIIP